MQATFRCTSPSTFVNRLHGLSRNFSSFSLCNNKPPRPSYTKISLVRTKTTPETSCSRSLLANLAQRSPILPISCVRPVSTLASTHYFPILHPKNLLCPMTRGVGRNVFCSNDTEPAVSFQIRHRSNRSRRGLYDGKDIRSGKSVCFSAKRNNRKFKPNVFKKRVYSETLDEMIRFNLTTSALRSIDKAGGLDNYLLTSKHVTEGQGLEAKERILERMRENKEMEERSAV